MSTIKGIFEPFARYVVDQLRLRKAIVSNKGVPGSLGSDENLLVELQATQNTGTWNDMFKTDRTDDVDDEASVLLPDVQVIEKLPAANLLSRHPHFYTYTSEKQCVIRMASGVDVNEKNNILREGEEYLTGTNLAYNWVLEGGIKGSGGTRGGLYDGTFSTSAGFAYGDPRLRADAGDGFGVVPMPGIIDAEINTKSEDGSLREARVNFVCFNRRQLEVLETLYMRPGYPIMLEWGWVPYINNDGEVINNSFGILEEFFKKTSDFDKINFAIKDQKIKSGGNYDGFLGFCKNFHFQAREDGGYDCTTEIIAQGEILESLKTPTRIVKKLPRANDYEYNDETGVYKLRRESETVDSFLFYLKSIKANLDQAGIEATLKYVGTDRMRSGEVSSVNHLALIFQGGSDSVEDGGAMDVNPEAIVQPISRIQTYEQERWNEETQQYEKVTVQSRDARVTATIQNLETSEQGVLDDDVLSADATIRTKNSKYYNYFLDDNGNVIPLHNLNIVQVQHVEGLQEVEQLISDITKVPLEELQKQKENWKVAPEFLLTGYSNERRNPGGDIRDKNTTSQATMRSVEGLGFESIYEGTILKEFSLEDESNEDSGIRKKIYLRWDLICQLFNRKIIPEYKTDKSVTELTYLTKDTPTYKEGTPPDGTTPYSKWKGVGGYYIPYSKSETNTIMPLDSIGLSDVHMQRLLEQAESRDEEDGDYILTGELAAQWIGAARMGQFKQRYGDDVIINVTKGTVEYPPLLGRSYDRSVCIMPHQLPQMTELESLNADSNLNLAAKKGKKNFTSFEGVAADANSIGHVFFNLDYLIDTYESVSLEEYKTTDDLGKEKTKRRLKKKFSVHAWITTVWNGVNDACGGYYDFGLHTEHERPNVARIIDFTMSGGTKDTLNRIYEFDPQGLYSVTRENYFQSKLDNDFASVVSIAAQSPNDINSLEATSFKAFHKGITSRFTDKTNTSYQDEVDRIEAAAKEYIEDYKEYEDSVRSLLLYVNRMNLSNYESTMVENIEGTGRYLQRPISVSTAKSMAASLDSQRIALLSRYPEIDENGVRYDINHPEGKYMGQYRDDLSNKGSFTFNRNAIVPLTSTLTLDGISGINPLNIYKIKNDKLPVAYKDPNIVFCVKKELHKITAGQDWTVDIEGHLTLLNDNPTKGTNPSLLIGGDPEIDLTVVDEGWEKWLNEFIKDYSWSAVFISWCVKEAEKVLGKDDFIPWSAHTGYFEKNKGDIDYDAETVPSLVQDYLIGDNPEVVEPTGAFFHLDPKVYGIMTGDILIFSNTGGNVQFPGPYSGGSHADIVTSIGTPQGFSYHRDIKLIGGNVGSPLHIEAGLFTANDGLIVGEKTTPGSTTATGDVTNNPHLPILKEESPYYNGSILRARDYALGSQIAAMAEGELRNWPMDLVNNRPKTERDPETEDIIRKYIAASPQTIPQWIIDNP